MGGSGMVFETQGVPARMLREHRAARRALGAFGPHLVSDDVLLLLPPPVRAEGLPAALGLRPQTGSSTI